MTMAVRGIPPGLFGTLGALSVGHRVTMRQSRWSLRCATARAASALAQASATLRTSCALGGRRVAGGLAVSPHDRRDWAAPCSVPFVLHLLEAALDLRRPEPAVAAEGPNGRDLAGARPSGDRLGVDSKEGRHLCGRQKVVSSTLFNHVSIPSMAPDGRPGERCVWHRCPFRDPRYGRDRFRSIARKCHSGSQL